MNQYFGYIRVSTTKQGEQGVSLQQQRESIERYAQRNGFEICQWFEEQVTAAKQGGRPVFGRLIKLLKCGKAAGVIIHKIDRGARNLADWASLGELIDQGVEVCFANESLDLRSRGGRLSADIQAVVAADYIRNLREETKKGFYGRLKQGLLPMPAPLGYVDRGQGKPKEPDPATAPLVRRAFELYATGRFNFRCLCKDLAQMGLRTRKGHLLTKNKLTKIFHNPFYMGLIRIKKANQIYSGAHEPLVSRHLFERVQAILHGKLNTRAVKHDFLFRRRLKCKQCSHTLIGETRKGYIYYRCQNSDCPTKMVRQEAVESAVLEKLSQLSFSNDERRFLDRKLKELKATDFQQREEAVRVVQIRLGQIEDRVARLTDAYIDRLLDGEAYEQRKTALLSERSDLKQRLVELDTGLQISEQLADFLGRAKSAYSAYKAADLDEKRELVDTLTSDRVLDGKLPVIMLAFPFDRVSARGKRSLGGPRRDIHRIWESLFQELVDYFRSVPQYAQPTHVH